MPVNPTLKSRNLDETDRKILTILSRNARETLTNIAKQVDRSIDSVNKRIKEMQRKEIFEFGIFVEPRNIGFPFVADVKIKLQNITEKETMAFVAHLKNHSRVIDLISLMGDYDFTCVIIAKSAKELDNIAIQIRQKYSHLIADWKAMMIIEQIKFEEYDFTS